MGHNFTVPIRIHEKYLQIIPKFGKCGPPCEGRGGKMDDGLWNAPVESRVFLLKTESGYLRGAGVT